MAGVRDELPHPHLALLPRVQRRTDVPQHPVERRADLTDLGAWISLGVGNPFEQGHLAAVQRKFGDPGRGGRNPAQRAQGHTDHRGTGDPGGDEPGSRHTDLDEDQGGECAAHLGGGNTHEDGRAVTRADGLDAVAAQSGQLDVAGLALHDGPGRLQGVLLGFGQGLRALLRARPAVLEVLRLGDGAVHGDGADRLEGLAAEADEVQGIVTPELARSRPALHRSLDRRAHRYVMELVVQLPVHVAVEGDRGDRTDHGGDHRDERHRVHDETGAERPGAARALPAHGVTHPA